MSFLRTTVTGSIFLPDGSVMPDGANIIFTLRSWDKDADLDAVALPGPIVATVEDGVISVELIRTASTDLQVTYDVGYIYRNQWTQLPVPGRLGVIAISGAGPLDLADILSLPVPVPNVPDALAQALAAAAEAMQSAQEASNAAYMALVGTGAGFDTVAQMVASAVVYGANNLTAYGQSISLNVAVGDIWKAEGFRYKVLVLGSSSYDHVTEGGVLVQALPSSDGLISALALGCEVTRTTAEAATSVDSAARIQAVLDRGYDVFLPGYVRIDSQINLNGRKVKGMLRRGSGFWCATAASGVLVVQQGAQLEELSVESDYTAEFLVIVGNGVQGNQSNDLRLTNVYASGAKTQDFLPMEFANWNAIGCNFTRTGGRTGTTGGAIDDARSVGASIRCVGSMTDCNITGATGWSVDMGFEEGWEENRLQWLGGRIHTGAEGLLRKTNYVANDPMTSVFTALLWENPGITGNPGVNNSGLEEAVQAIGPGAIIQINNPRKATMRKATAFIAAMDGGRVELNNPCVVGFQTLGSAATGCLAATLPARAMTFAADLLISSAGDVVEYGGLRYAPKAGLLPFTTTETFDAAQWDEVTSHKGPGQVIIDTFPEISSDGITGDFSAWVDVIRAQTALGSPSIDFKQKALVRTILDGTDMTGIDPNPNTSTIGITTDAGEFLSEGAAIEVQPGSGTTTAANIKFLINIEEDLVGRPLMISAVHAYKQIGATFGNAGTVRCRMDLKDSTIVTEGELIPTGTCFPPNGSTEPTDLSPAPGAGNLTGWYRTVHVFVPQSAGTLQLTLVYDALSVTRDDYLILDNVKLWALRDQKLGGLI